MNSTLRTTSVCCALFLAFLFVFPTPISAGLKEHASETILPNGLKVILLEDHRAPLIVFQLCYRAGSRNETWGKTGLSHMLEHMMYKGTKKAGPEEFSRVIQANGGDDNAFTSNDSTCYFSEISSDRIHVPMELEADRMQNIIFREDHFRTEKMIVMEERRLLTEDDPVSYLEEQVNAAAFQTSPYHWPVIGWMEDIRNLTLEDVKTYRSQNYGAGNAFLVVAGDFKRDEMLRLLSPLFGKIPAGQSQHRRNFTELQTGERRVTTKRGANLPFVLMAFHAPNIKDKDCYVLEVIAEILAGGRNSRLYRNLVYEKKFAIDVDAANPLLSTDLDLFTISVQPLHQKNLSDIEKEIDQEIERLRKELVSERELQAAKNRIEADFTLEQDSISYQATLIAEYETSSSWREIDDYLTSIRKVTPEDITRVVKKYLNTDNRTVGILMPALERN